KWLRVSVRPRNRPYDGIHCGCFTGRFIRHGRQRDTFLLCQRRPSHPLQCRVSSRFDFQPHSLVHTTRQKVWHCKASPTGTARGGHYSALRCLNDARFPIAIVVAHPMSVCQVKSIRVRDNTRIIENNPATKPTTASLWFVR